MANVLTGKALLSEFEWSKNSEILRMQLDLANRVEYAKGVRMPDNVFRSHQVWTCPCKACIKWREEAERIRALVFGAEAEEIPTVIAGVKG